jgi:hypothetical protein
MIGIWILVAVGVIFWLFCGLCVASLIEEADTVYKRLFVAVFMPLIPLCAALYAIYKLLTEDSLS